LEGIVGIDRFEVTIEGVANHAGTTPMPDRHDALIAASRLVLAVNEVVRAEPGRQVGTVGQLTVSPNAPNVVPGLVKMTIELRDLSDAKVTRLAKRIEFSHRLAGDGIKRPIAACKRCIEQQTRELLVKPDRGANQQARTDKIEKRQGNQPEQQDQG
jgi:acetylornithine deacetylase/succinyl-diaminopimelate desuccinylase-like protein